MEPLPQYSIPTDIEREFVKQRTTQEFKVCKIKAFFLKDFKMIL